jgi:hypothetical protein
VRLLAGRLTTIAAVAAVLAPLPATGAADASWTTARVVRLPVTLALPTSWAVFAPSGTTRFFAQAGTRDAYVTLVESGYGGPPSGFAQTELTNARKVYLRQDPKAAISSKTVTLPGGEALEVVTRLVRGTGKHATPLSITDYAFLRAGRVYEFTYVTATPKAGTYAAVFGKSARSIRFG